MKKSVKFGPNQRKVLLLLAAGTGLMFARTPGKYWKIVRSFKSAWKEVNERALRISIQKLYALKLIHERHNADGTISITLNDQGRKTSLRYSLDAIAVAKPKQWDRKWRIVLFDVPEEAKRVREAIRYHLKRLGFYEFQKSVFIYPYECRKEIDFIVEYFMARKYVRYIIADALDNELDFRSKFSVR